MQSTARSTLECFPQLPTFLVQNDISLLEFFNVSMWNPYIYVSASWDPNQILHFQIFLWSLYLIESIMLIEWAYIISILPYYILALNLGYIQLIFFNLENKILYSTEFTEILIHFNSVLQSLMQGKWCKNKYCI